MRLGDSPVFARQLPPIHGVSVTSLNTTVSASQLLSMQTSAFQIRVLLSLYPTMFLKLFWLLTPAFASVEQNCVLQSLFPHRPGTFHIHRESRFGITDLSGLNVDNVPEGK